MNRRIWLASAAGLVLGACLKSGLPEIGQVPEFELVDQDGRQFSSARDLKGRIWVADFFFTTCNGPCPRMTALMRKVQDATRQWPSVRLVSFTVDPAGDTPDKLKEYGRRFRQDPSRWYFLTGPAETLGRLSGDTFHLGGLGPVHGTRFALVDAKGRIRAYYETSDSSCVDQVVEDIRKLQREVF